MHQTYSKSPRPAWGQLWQENKKYLTNYLHCNRLTPTIHCFLYALLWVINRSMHLWLLFSAIVLFLANYAYNWLRQFTMHPHFYNDTTDKKVTTVQMLRWMEYSLTPHSTQYRSFWRWSSQPITWLTLTNKTVQENTDKQTLYKSEKSKQPEIQQNKTTLVQLPLTTLGQETRWAYSTTQ